MRLTITIFCTILLFSPSLLFADGFKMVKIDSLYMQDEILNFPETSFLSMNNNGDVVFNLRGDIALLKNGQLQYDKRLPMFAAPLIPSGIANNYRDIRLVNNQCDLYVLIGRNTNSLCKRENNEWKIIVKDISEYWKYNSVGSFNIDNEGIFWFVSYGVPCFHRFDGKEITKIYGKDTIDPNNWALYPGLPSYGSCCIGTNLYYMGGFGSVIKFDTKTGEREVFVPVSAWLTDNTPQIISPKIKMKKGKYWFATARPSLIGFDENGYEVVDLSGGKLSEKIGKIEYIDDFAMADDGSYWLSTREDSTRLYHIFSKDSFRIHNEIQSQHRSLDKEIPNIVKTLGIETAPNETVYIITDLGALLYYGENPLYVKDDSENDSNFGLYSIYPNPAKDKINVEIICNSTFNPNFINLDLYNYTGEKIKSIKSYSFERNRSSGTATFKFDTPNIPKGFYFLSINVDGKTQAKSIIIDK
ncbi:MAG: T9SS type A sorting domain-containing protein [bacterium]